MLKQLVAGAAAMHLRVLLVALAGWFANNGFAFYDRAAGTVTFEIESLSNALAAFGLWAAWWLWRRAVKLVGGVT